MAVAASGGGYWNKIEFRFLRVFCMSAAIDGLLSHRWHILTLTAQTYTFLAFYAFLYRSNAVNQQQRWEATSLAWCQPRMQLSLVLGVQLLLTPAISLRRRPKVEMWKRKD